MMSARPPLRFGRLTAAIAIFGAAMPGCSTIWGFDQGKPLADGSGGQGGALGGATAKGGTAPSHSGGAGGPSGGTTSSGGAPGANGGKPTSGGGTNQGGRNQSGSGGGPSSQGGDNPVPQGGDGGAGANGGTGGEAGFGGACIGCDIGGHCVREGSLNESNACLICDSSRSASDWSYRDGAACDDKVFCNGGDTCNAGSCSQHVGDPCVASNDTCNATLDVCCKSKLTNVCNASGNPVEVDSCGHEVRMLDACVTPNGSCVNGNCVCAAGWAGDDCSQCVRYVRAGASGIGNGKSWAQAISSISDALASWPTCQIWVYQGSYVPGSVTGTDPRAATFAIPAAARVYGGFSGSERSLAERDLSKHASILNGDIGVVDDPSDNAYHVVTLGDGAVLDGFTVTGGNGSTSSGTYTGSAVYAAGASASVANCELTGDLGAVEQSNIKVLASVLSGGINLTRGSLAVTGCALTKAGVHGPYTRMTIVDSTFVGSGTGVSGAAQAVISRSSFSGVTTPISGDDLALDHVTIESGGTAISVNKGNFSAVASTFRDNARIATMRDTQFRCDGCTFVGNRNGIQLSNASTYVTNSVFLGNSGTLTTLGADSAARFAGCIFYDNDLSVDSTRPISIVSSILWKNRTRPPVQVAVTYSDIDDPTTLDATNFSADPLFVSTTQGALDFRLRAGSPCIDRAPNDSLVPALDALGHERYDDPGTPNLNGTITDLGAYEWRPE